MADRVKGFTELGGDNHDVRVYQQNMVTVSRTDIMAAVDEPDGRKANWLEKARFLMGRGKLDTENVGQRFVARYG